MSAEWLRRNLGVKLGLLPLGLSSDHMSRDFTKCLQNQCEYPTVLRVGRLAIAECKTGVSV